MGKFEIEMEEVNADKNERWIPTKKFFSDALLVAVLTGAGYLAAFAYQFFYLRYFDIPILFASVTLESVLLAMAIGFLFLLSLLGCIEVIISYEIKNERLNFAKILFMIFIMLFIMVTPIIALYFNINNVIVFIMTLIILAAIVAGMAIYVAKHPEQSTEKKSLLSIAEKAFGSFPVLFVGALILFIVYCGGMGAMVAQGTTDYLVSNTDPQLIIVSTYSGNFIGLTFDSSTKTFYKDMTLISPDEISKNNIVFDNQTIGPLKAN
jgi:hypothetical protein